MAIFEGTSEKVFIDLTVDWMKENYQRMNELLFDSCLGDCLFGIFTTGTGSEGHTLGRFQLTGPVKAKRSNRRMFVRYGGYWGEDVVINSNNFAYLCKPKITMNGNYRWTQKGALSTLVHEMCHYYTYKDGFIPLQGHGTEFKHIAMVVSAKSNEFFTVQRLSSAEKMSEVELDPKFIEKREKRSENKRNSIIPTFVFEKNGNINLVNCSNVNLLKSIVNMYRSKRLTGCDKIIASVDDNLKQVIFDSGYRASMRTYRYWPLNPDSEIVKALYNSNYQVWYSADEDESSERMGLAEAKRLIRKLTAQVLEETKF